MSEQVVKRYGISGFGGGMIEQEDGAFYHMDDYDALHAEAEALRADMQQLRRIHADAVDRLNGQIASWCSDYVTIETERNAMRTELETARGLLAQLRGMINCTAENDADKMPVWISTKHPVIERIDAFLTATPAPEVQAEQGERQEAVVPGALCKHYSEIDQISVGYDFSKNTPVNDQTEDLKKSLSVGDCVITRFDCKHIPIGSACVVTANPGGNLVIIQACGGYAMVYADHKDLEVVSCSS